MNLKIILKKVELNLRNQIVAFIFAIKWFRIKNAKFNLLKMRRDIFQAIADPTRRAIIALIAMHAMTPNAIATHFDSSRQAISKHLRILTECEVVQQKQEGREIYYSLEVYKMKEIDNWLNQFRQIWEGRFDELDKVLLNLKNEKK